MSPTIAGLVASPQEPVDRDDQHSAKDVSLEQRVLSLPEDVRARPGMFVGDVDASGVLQLVLQLVDNALDQHLAGQVSRLEVTVHDDHFCVSDDGPGMSARELAPTRTQPTRPHSWLHSARLGLALVNSLARRVEIESCRHRARRRWVFENFATIIEGERLGRCSSSGTTIRVWPDPEVFRATRPDLFGLEQRLLGVHRLRPALSVELDGARFEEPAGTEAWVAGQRSCNGHRVHHIEARRGTTELELAWAWLPPFGSARRLSYVNLDETTGDGSHVDGLLTGLARAHGVSLAMARECTLALISVVSINPRFAGATQTRLDDPALGQWIAGLVEHHQA